MHGVGKLLPEIPPAHVLLLRIPDSISFYHKGPASFTLKLLFAQFSYLFLASLTLSLWKVFFTIWSKQIDFFSSGRKKKVKNIWGWTTV